MASLDTLTSSVGTTFTIAMGKTDDFANQTRSISDSWTNSLTIGTGAGNGDQCFADQRTLAGSANETLDLQSLTTSFGVAVVFTKVKVLAIKVVSTNADSTITVGASGASAFNTPFAGDDTFAVTVRPGGWVLWACDDTTAYAVSGTVKDLKIVNNSSSSLDYKIIIIGID